MNNSAPNLHISASLHYKTLQYSPTVWIRRQLEQKIFLKLYICKFYAKLGNFIAVKRRSNSLPADVLWGLFVTHWTPKDVCGEATGVMASIIKMMLTKFKKDMIATVGIERFSYDLKKWFGKCSLFVLSASGWKDQNMAFSFSRQGKPQYESCYRVAELRQSDVSIDCRKFSEMSFFHPRVPLTNQKPRVFVYVW